MQDQHLERIGRGVGDLKEIARMQGDELHRQEPLLEVRRSGERDPRGEVRWSGVWALGGEGLRDEVERWEGAERNVTKTNSFVSDIYAAANVVHGIHMTSSAAANVVRHRQVPELLRGQSHQGHDDISKARFRLHSRPVQRSTVHCPLG